MGWRAEIPYGCYWSTPFARWQGALSGLHSIEFAAHVVRAELARRGIPPPVFDHGVLGISVPQQHAFYGLPWLAGRAGIGQIGGPTLMQACATGVRALLAGAQEIECGMSSVSLTVTCDRTSNGPHLYYPNPRGPGGTGTHEDWVLDNFNCDPLGPHAMLATAEECRRSPAARVEAVGSIGAGDSMLSGMLVALAKGWGLTEAMRFGVAAGSAALLHPGTELCRREDTERLYHELCQP